MSDSGRKASSYYNRRKNCQKKKIGNIFLLQKWSEPSVKILSGVTKIGLEGVIECGDGEPVRWFQKALKKFGEFKIYRIF